MKINLAFNEKVERITKALDKAVPKDSKSNEVVYALCILQAYIFINSFNGYVDKDEYFFVLKQIIRDIIEKNKNK